MIVTLDRGMEEIEEVCMHMTRLMHMGLRGDAYWDLRLGNVSYSCLDQSVMSCILVAWEWACKGA